MLTILSILVFNPTFNQQTLLAIVGNGPPKFTVEEPLSFVAPLIKRCISK